MTLTGSTATPLPSVDRYYCCPTCGGPGSGVAETYVNREHCSRWRCCAGCERPWYVIRCRGGMEVDRVELAPPVPRVYSLDHLERQLGSAIEPYAHRAGRPIAYAAQLGARLAAALAIDGDVRESGNARTTTPPVGAESDAERCERIERIRADAMFGREDEQLPCDHCGYTHTVEIRAQQDDLLDLLEEVDRLRQETKRAHERAALDSVARVADLLAMAEGRCPIAAGDENAVSFLRRHLAMAGDRR